MAVKHYLKKIEKTTIFFIKLCMFASLFGLFFWLFSIDNPQILNQSRTAAITMTTFVILGISMTVVYGGFAVGKKKSKEIIPPLSIAAFITDFVTYFQLCIMNVNQYNEATLTFQNIGILLLVFLLQVVTIWLYVYLGNYVYFKINPPENCIIVCEDIQKASEILPKIGRYKRQYKITDIITYRNENMKSLIRHSDSVFIYEVPAEFRSEIVDYAYKHFTNIYLTTELSDVVISYAKPIVIDDLSMLCSNIKDLSFEQKIIKRLLDIIISGFALIVFSPVMLAEAIFIKLYDKGPVFFRQERLTKDGKKFNVLKFRTMIVDAEKNDIAVLSQKNDIRITPIGRFLRATRMDELPQFLNVLYGDMSIVGPRPERESIALEYYKDLPQFKYRLRAKAGLTGLAQIAGKYNTSPKDKLILDLMYIEKYSVWMDILLMFQTVGVFFKSDSTEGFSDEQMVEFVKHQVEQDINTNLH